jgi:hypothetical protein
MPDRIASVPFNPCTSDANSPSGYWEINATNQETRSSDIGAGNYS